MRTIAAILAMAVLLTACASGRFLTGTEAASVEAAILLAETGVVIRIAPLYDPELVTQVPASHPLDLAVAGGWYKVAYACDVPDCGDLAGSVMIREYTTERRVRVEPGRRYQLSCSCKRFGVLNIRELGDEPN